jgi:hypothetical protein
MALNPIPANFIFQPLVVETFGSFENCYVSHSSLVIVNILVNFDAAYVLDSLYTPPEAFLSLQ